jgi:hypothetical protein
MTQIAVFIHFRFYSQIPRSWDYLLENTAFQPRWGAQPLGEGIADTELKYSRSSHDGL